MAEIEKEKEEARQRTAEDERLLADWNAKRDTSRAGVSADLLQHYDRISKHRGSGIAEVRDQKCMGCQVMLRPQTFNEVRTGERTVSCDSCQRILYYVPGQETVATAVAATTQRRRPRPKLDANNAWYYRSDYGDAGEVFLSYINADGNSTRRIYDVHSGRKLENTLVREGEYRLGFPEDLPAAIRLNGKWSEEELDEWEDELPTVVIDRLQRDLDLARAEAAGKSQVHAAVPNTEHSAAS
jgi:hypothetical protein